MAFVCVSVITANLAIVAWSVISVEDDMTFTNLLDSVKAGKYTIILVSEKLARSEIEKVFVGTDKTALSMVDQRLNVVEVTSKFGSYVKFAVKCEDEPQQPICIYCSSEDIETPDQERYYPQCQECSDKPQISKRTANKSA